MKYYNNTNEQIAILGKLHGGGGGDWRPGSTLQAMILIIYLLQLSYLLLSADIFM